MIRQRWSFPTIHADFICKLLLNEIGQIWKTGIVKKKKKKKKILAGHPKASEHNSTWGNHTCIFQGVEQRRLCWMSRISLSVVWRPQRSQMLSSIYSCPPVWSLLKLTVVPGCQFIHFLQKCNFPPFLHFSLGSCGVPIQKPTCSQSDRFLNLPLCKMHISITDYEMMGELMGRNA